MSLLVQVVFPEQVDTDGMTFDAGGDMRRVGGPIHLDPGGQQQVTVQVYVDHSAVEVFLTSGEALATRCTALTCTLAGCHVMLGQHGLPVATHVSG